MTETSTPTSFWSSRYSTLAGVVVLVVVTALGLVAVANRWSTQDLSPTPLITLPTDGRRVPLVAKPCRVGQVCSGPTVAAKDPEGEKLTYRFYDQQTNQLVGQPIQANSGQPVTPKFEFNEIGDKRLYMVVEDGAGHKAPDYPIIIPIQN
jgi:hypothetical protein